MSSSHCNIQGLKGLLQTLSQYLDKELDLWIPISPVATQKEMMSAQRSDLVDWLITLNRRFDFSTETLFLSVDVFDRFLQLVKAQNKYLRCIAVTCLYIGAKINEEDNVIPATQELVQVSECGCSEAEILRMERCILNKFDWNPRASPTSIEFIHLFHALVLNKCPMLVSSTASLDVIRRILNEALLLCLHRTDLLEYSPSTIALSVLSIYLEMTWLHWKPATQRLQVLVQLSDADLSECRQVTSRCLGSYLLNFAVINKTTSSNIPPPFYDRRSFLSSNFLTSLSPLPNTCVKSGSIASCRLEALWRDDTGRENSASGIRKEMTPPPSLPVTPNPPSKRRRVEQDDDVYDDIRKLYDDDSSVLQRDVVDMSCGMEMSSIAGHNEGLCGSVTLPVPIATV